MKWLILVTSLANIFLGVFIWRRSPKRKLNIYFGILAGITGLWVFNNFLFRVFPDLFFLRNAYAIGALVPALAAIWILHFSERKIPKIGKVILAITAISFSILSHVNGFIVEDLIAINFAGYEGTTGPFFPLYALYMFGILGYLVYVLFSSARKSYGVRKARTKLVFIGLTLWIINVLVVSFFLPMFGVLEVTSLDSPSSLIFIGFIAFAITRYRLMDIRAIVARTIAFGSIVITLAAIFAVMSALIAFFFSSLIGLRSDLITGVIISVLVAFFYKPMVRVIEKLTNNFLFKKSYDADELISDISNLSASTIDIEKLLKGFYKILNEAFNFEKFGVSLINSEGTLDIYYKQGFNKGVAEGLVSYPDVANILQKQLKENPGVQVIDEMKTRFENGEFKPVDPQLLSVIHENNIAVVVPLYVKKNLTGIIVLGSKKSGDPYSHEDIKVLEIFGDQAAIAVDNSKLYEELRYFNIKLEEEVEEKTKQLRKANVDLKKLDTAKSEFISIASHQLRTPLTVIKGYISMMKEGSFGPIRPKILTNLDKVYVSNERLITLVENLLDISRIESGRQEFAWKKVQLEELAAEVTEKLQDSAAKKKLKLTYHKPKVKLPAVVIDDGRLHEVMMNFVDNAVKYTKKGSVDVYITKEEEMLTFCVKDTGKGMSEDGKSKLFKKFSRGKDSFKQHTEGLGLGLYVATMMMRAHEGKIWADSEGEGKGSSFCFSVPIKGKHKDGDISKIDGRVVEEVKAEDKKQTLK